MIGNQIEIADHYSGNHYNSMKNMAFIFRYENLYYTKFCKQLTDNPVVWYNGKMEVFS